MDFRLKFALQGQKHGRWETISNMTAEGVPGFENMFVVKNYETGPITLYVQWAYFAVQAVPPGILFHG